MKTKILAAIFCLVLPLPAFAGWVGPKVVVSGTWGNRNDQFTLSHSDMGDDPPEFFDVSKNNYIIISDEKMRLFNPKGLFMRIIPPPMPDPQKWLKLPIFVGNNIIIIGPKLYVLNYSGELISEIEIKHKVNWKGVSGENLYLLQEKPYKMSKYSSSGELIKTDVFRPLELGVWSFTCKTGFKTLQKCHRLHFDIEYPDAVYILEVDRVDYKTSLEKQIKISDSLVIENQGESVYAYGVTSTIPTIEGRKEKRYLKWKSTWQKPQNQIIKKYITDQPHPIGYEITVIAEYGDPMIGPDGSIYCWKRSKTHYKILKWSWKD